MGTTTTTTTTALQSIGLWQLQTQASSQSVLDRTAFFVSPGIAGGRRLPLHRYILNSKKPRFPSSVFNNGNRVILSISSASTTTTTSTVPSDAAETVLGAEEIKQKCCKWLWKGQYSINYFVSSDADSPQQLQTNPPLLLVHGFGASIPHWRRNIKTLARSHTVYAIDLLGFGASDKPPGFSYTMETWAQLILDFLDEVIQKPTVLVGNSVGSLACVIAASVSNQIQKGIASAIFERVKQRENLRNILLSVYGNKESVDEELVEIIREPANNVGALDAFVSIVTGPPGPNPVQLMPRISLPVLVLWGDQDPFTPIDGPVGKYFSSLPSQQANVKLSILEGVGHCPHDDRPESVHEKLLPWLASLPTS